MRIFAENKKVEDYEKEQLRETADSANSGIRQYGIYSAIVFQMLATMGIGFWGGKKLNDYLQVQNNLVTIGIGLAFMALAFYNLLRQLKNVQNEK